MRAFLDLMGHSGATYRYRLAEPHDLPPTAGAFAFVRSVGDGGDVLCCGTSLSLTNLGPAWREAVEQHRASAVYVRLNVIRELREREHLDVIAHLQPAQVVTELA